MGNVFRANSYQSEVDGLQSAYIVGRVNMYGRTFIHLVFTEAAADWQMWVEPGDKPVPRRVEII